MDGFANGAEMTACPHCGADMRRGMIRCRECGKSAKETEEDFELTGHALLPSQDPKCPRCGSMLEPGVADCAVCASRMLDQLMSGPPPVAPAPNPNVNAPRQMSIMEQRVRQAAQAAKSQREAPAEFETIVDASPTAVRPRSSAPAASKGATVTQPAANPARSPSAPNKAQAPVARSDNPAAPPAVAPSASPPKPAIAAPEEEEIPTASVETSPACAALLASLAAADATLRCEIASALGKLGDKAALEPLERHMGDKDIRVRRAVATALVQLGHPKGETLLGIAERMPASSVLMLANSSQKVKKSAGGGGGTSIDQKTLIQVGGGLLAAAVVGGGIWMWMNSSPAPRGRGKKPKPAATAKAPASKSKPAAKPAAD